MEHQTHALIWALTNRDKLKLEIESLSWINDILPGWSDVYATVELHGTKFVGWGADKNGDTALCKAIAEALERFSTAQQRATTSNGFAVHLQEQAAEVNARRELEERDLFLCHFLTRTAFAEAALSDLMANSISKAIDWANSSGLHLRYFRLGSRGILCVANGYASRSPFGNLFGAGMRDSLESSAITATIETLRQAAILIERAELRRPLSLQAFSATERPGFTDHLRLSLDLDYSHSIDRLFQHDAQATSLPESEGLADSEFTFETHPLSLPGCSPSPFLVSRASAPNLQNIWLGKPKESDINLARLSKFKKAELQWTDLDLRPHPFN